MRSLPFLMIGLFLASGLCLGDDSPKEDRLKPVNASEAILNAFDKYRVVALGEAHGLQEEHDFIQSLVRNPAFAAKVNDIVVECGNALFQDILDRYIAGQDVPMAEVRPVWRDTTQSAVGLWNALIYEQLFTTVREVNRKLPPDKRLRVLAGDPPIDWKKVAKRSDADPFLGQRDAYFASVVEQQVLAKNRKALLIIGTVHLFKARPRVTPGTNAGQPPPGSALGKRPGNVTQLLDVHHPGSVFVIAPHRGFGMLRPELAELNAKLEARLATWSKPSLVVIKDTWLGALETTALIPPMIGPDGRPRDPFAGLTLGDMVDAYLYLGPRDSLTRSNPSPETLNDRAYLDELSRRSQLLFGQPFDPRRLSSSGKQFYDPNARPPIPAAALRGQDAQKDLDKLQGTWVLTAMEKNGNAAPEYVLGKLTVTFKGDTMVMGGQLTAAQGKEPVKPEFTVKLDPSKKPKAIDATPLSGNFKGKTVSGIYQLEGEELKICLPKQGDKERPSDFKSPEGSDLAFMTFKRSKK